MNSILEQRWIVAELDALQAEVDALNCVQPKTCQALEELFPLADQNRDEVGTSVRRGGEFMMVIDSELRRIWRAGASAVDRCAENQ